MLAERRVWLSALRVFFTGGLLVASVFPILSNRRNDDQLWLYGYAENMGGGPIVFIAGAWTLATLGLALAALVTPAGRLGRIRQWATVVALACFALGHVMLAGLASSQNSTMEVYPNYAACIVLAAAAAAAWIRRSGIDRD